MKTRKRLLVGVLVLAIMLTLILGIVACKPTPDPTPQFVPQGEEATYYCDGQSGEYTIQLRQGQFSLLIAGDSQVGTYVFDKDLGEIALTFADGSIARATLNLAKGELSIRHKDVNYALTKKVSYTVTFETNGGSAVAPATVVNGRTVARPVDPVKGDQVFAGWYKDSALTKPYNFRSDKITANTTLYARYVQQTDGKGEFSVNLVNNGQVVETRKTINGSLYNLPELKETGKTFLGWWISDSNNADKLTRQYFDTEVIQQNTSLYAVWEGDVPTVSVFSDRIEWTDAGADRYEYVVTKTDVGEFDDPVILASGMTENTFASVNFADAESGEYEVIITVGGKTAKAYYNNKTLAQVSLFEVNGNDLIFNKVANATEYTITVICGDETHDHRDESLGASSTYNFANCQIAKDGYKFTVTAKAQGYVSSVSETFEFNRSLGEVKNITRNNDETVSWDAVEGATTYLVKITNGQNVEEKTVYTNSIDVGMYRGNVTVEVTPVAFGYNATAQQISYVNNRLVAPSNIRVNMSTITWDAVEGATYYIVKIGDKEYVVYGNSLTMDETYYVPGQVEYVISIKAVASNSADSSMFSEEFRAQYGVMGSTIKYNNNVLSWDAVFGAVKYVITINAGEETETVIEVTDGSLSATIVWPRAGVNTISVYSVDKDGVKSSAVSTQVTTYAITFVVGENAYPVDTIFKAIGDEYVLPEARGLGVAFGGWYDREDYANGKKLDNTGIFAGEFTVYAGWTSEKYTITFDIAGEGTFPEDEEKTATVYFGENYQWPVPTTENTSRVFAGWYSEPRGAGTKYTDEKGKSVNVFNEIRNRTVYAAWVEVFSFEVTYNADTKEYDSVSVSAGPGIGLVNTLVIPGSYYGKLTYLETYQDEVGNDQIREVTETKYWTVTTVGANAFKGITTIYDVMIPETISYVAWGGNGVYYDGSAFASCSNFRSITVYDIDEPEKEVGYSLTANYWSQDGVLYRNDKATGAVEVIYYPYAKTDATYVMPYGVTNIPQYTFRSAKFVTVSLPASIRTLNKCSFYSCSSLVSLTFRDPVDGETANVGLELAYGTTTNAAIYSNSKLETITFPSSLSNFNSESIQACSALAKIIIGTGDGFGDNYSSIFYKNDAGEIVGSAITDRTRTTLIYIPGGYAGEPMYDEKGLQIGSKFVVPNGITTLGTYSFGGTSSTYAVDFTHVYIPGSVTLIKEYAFRYCSKLTDLVFEGAKDDDDLTIESYAFASCTVLESVTLPPNLVTLESCAFALCSKLTTVYVEADRDEVDYEEYAFGDFRSPSATFYVQNVYIGKTAPEINFKGVFGNVVLQGVHIDPQNPFYKSDEDGVVFNRAMTKVMFFPMGKSGSYTLPDTIVEVAGGTFAGAFALTEVIIPSSVQTIGVSAFENCTVLDTVTFLPTPEGKEPVKLTLGNSMLAGCTALRAIEIPARTSVVGQHCFNGCLRLSSITFEETPEGATPVDLEISFSAFRNIGNSDVQSQQFTSIDLPDRLKSIENLAFMDCTYLRRVSFPASVEQIGSYLAKEVYIVSKDASGEIVQSTAKQKKDVLVSMSIFHQCYRMEEVIVDPANKYYASVDGVLYGKEYIDIVATNYHYAFVTSSGAYTYYYEMMNDKYYDYTDGTIKSLLYCPPGNSGNNGTITIPNTVMGLWYNAFGGNGSSAYFEEEVGLRKVAFSKNYIENNANNDVRIGNLVFSGCEKIEEVELPRGIKAITQQMFFECKALKKITIPNTVETIAQQAFDTCLNLYEVEFEDAEEGQDVIPLELLDSTSSSYSLFEDCPKLKRIELPERTTIIGKYMLASGIEEVVLPSTLQEIRYYALNGTGLKKVTFPNGLKAIGEDGYNGLIIHNYAFYSATDLEVLDLPEGIKGIGAYAFAYCRKLTQVTLPSTLEETGKYYSSATSTTYGYMFRYCSGLERIIFNNCQFTQINHYDFAGCTSLVSVEIPANVVVVDAYAFDGCTSLESITFGKDKNGENHLGEIRDYAFRGAIINHFEFPNTTAGNIVLGVSIFDGCENLTSIHLSEDVSSFGDSLSGAGSITNITVDSNNINFAEYQPKEGDPYLPMLVNKANDTVKFVYGTIVGELTIPDGFTIIDAGAFRNQTKITKVYLPATVHTINDSAFNGCTALEEVVYTLSTLNKIGDYAFAGTTSLKRFVIPEMVKTFEIGGYAFYNSGIKEFITTNALSYVGGYAFAGSNLEEIILPDSDVLVLAQYSFRDTHLKRVEFKGNIKSLGTYTFYQSAQLEEIVFGTNTSIKAFPTYFAYKCSSLKKIDFSNLHGLELIADGTYAFAYTGLTEITIPEKIHYLTKTKKNDTTTMYTFAYCYDLENVYWHDDINFIGGYVFYHCEGLKNLIINEGDTGLNVPSSMVGWGTYPFGYAGLEKAHIPATVTSMGTNTFYYCEQLREVTFEANSRKSLPNYTFGYCTSLKSIDLSPFTSLTHLGQYTFQYSGLESFVVPDGIKVFGSNATTCTKTTASYLFRGCASLKSIDLNNVTKVGTYAFSQCSSLETVIGMENLTVIGTRGFYNCCSFEELEDGTINVGEGGLKSITLGSKFAEIGQAAFAENYALETVVIEKSNLVTLGFMQAATVTATTSVSTLYGIFENCINLKNVTIPDNITTIRYKTFYGCSSLTDASFLNAAAGSLLDIQGRVFENTGIRQLDLSNLTKLNGCDYYAFANISNLQVVKFSTSFKTIGQYAFYGSNNITNVDFQNSKVESISNNAFEGCKELTTLKFPSTLTSISKNAFANCESLIEIDLSASAVVDIAESVFANAISLETLKLPGALETIGDSAFENARALKAISLPVTVTGLGENVFRNATSLQTIDLSSLVSILSIGKGAFENASMVTELKLPMNGSLAEIGANAFKDCVSVTALQIPDTVTTIGAGAFDNMRSITSVTIPAKVNSIGDRAFSGLRGVSAISVNPQNATFYTGTNGELMEKVSSGKDIVKSIPAGFAGVYTVLDSVELGRYPFKGCNGITGVIFAGTVTEIGEYAFAYIECSKVTIPATVTKLARGAFYNAFVQELTIPASVIELGVQAFACTPNIKSLTIPYTVERIGQYLLYGSGVEEVYYNIPSAIVVNAEGEEVDTLFLLDGATGLNKLVVSEGVTKVGKYLLSNLNELEVTIELPSTWKEPSFVTRNNNACVFNVIVAEGVTAFGESFLDNDVFPADETGPELEEMSTRNNVSTLGWIDDIIDQITGITGSTTKNGLVPCVINMTIPKSVLYVGDYAFRSCAVSDVNFKDTNITEMGTGVFYYGVLGEFEFPAKLVSVGHSSFGYAYAESVTIPVHLENTVAFSSATSTTLYDRMFYYATVGTVIFEEGIECINNTRVTSTTYNKFAYASIEKIVLPSTLKMIDDYAFAYLCRNSTMENLVIPEGVTYLGTYAFGYAGIQNIYLPSTITGEGVTTYTFYYLGYYQPSTVYIAMQETKAKSLLSIALSSTYAQQTMVYDYDGPLPQ